MTFLLVLCGYLLVALVIGSVIGAMFRLGGWTDDD
jgi:hypothetical protein